MTDLISTSFLSVYRTHLATKLESEDFYAAGQADSTRKTRVDWNCSVSPDDHTR